MSGSASASRLVRCSNSGEIVEVKWRRLGDQGRMAFSSMASARR